ncbi:MAG: hypothetical protein JXR58_01075 [Bacteroidales bacterium]|nr:hypothetical protein [Bacteroidales bacterium]
MLRFFFLVISFSLFISGFSQQNEPEIIDKTQHNQIVDSNLKSEFGIYYSIFRIYKYSDNIGLHYLILTERTVDSSADEPRNDSIMAFHFTKENEKMKLDWKLRDFVVKQSIGDNLESSIWFWSKYFQLKDIDNDGIVEPLLVYGSSGINGKDDGRIKIFVFYKGKKYGIRHQNGVYDGDRNTKVDKEFYDLPNAVVLESIAIMEKIVEDNNAIFPYGWQKAMKEKKVFFSEN